MVRHKILEIRDYVEQNQLLNALEALCDRFLTSNRNVIPIFEDAKMHAVLLKHNIVEIYSDDKFEFCKVDWNPYFGYASWKCLSKILGESPPENTQELVALERRLDEYRNEAKDYRFGRSEIVREANRFCLIIANYEYNEDFSGYLEYYKNDLYTAIRSMEKVLHYCQIMPNSWEIILSFGNDPLMYRCLPSFKNVLSSKGEYKRHKRYFFGTTNDILKSYVLSVGYLKHNDRFIIENDSVSLPQIVRQL